MTYKVKEVADLVGISVRTLHHYDEIGLLVPDQISEAGYRLYSEDNLETLQQILFFRELDFPLKKIKELMNRPDYDRQEALELHRKLILEKRNRLDKLLDLIDKTILHVKGEIKMSQKEKFEGFDFTHNPYEQEARDRWGDKKVDEAKEKKGKLTDAEQKEMQNEMEELYRQMAALRHGEPDSQQAQKLTHEWYLWLNKVGNYSLEAFKGLGELYTDDKRFKKNIDQFGEGLSEFLRQSMAVYADREIKERSDRS
ncbi:MerR family transcriptional regulator [Jeotgalibacillus campisalis]|uniref:MerR family transcriptional regulator n=1 Tax=Jeotgalibacillus campisalis TaxID=220754 RepID=A0A0C2VJL5_9BACL|nr:MerR family transcriptional regulator [Jeotgalibacillus campisalis]KIL49057.1 MerR family transcriptional regulator [Jeotgalibacillus campisalis]